LGRAFGPHLEVILEHDALPVEQEAFALRRRMIEQVVDERDETLAKSNEWVIPLAIPVRVRDDVGGEQDRVWAVGKTKGRGEVRCGLRVGASTASYLLRRRAGEQARDERRTG